MDKDQILGVLIFAGSLVGIVVYGALIYYYPMWILQISAFLAVAFVLGIMAWVGYVMATTPPPKPIEEVEKEIETKETKTESETKEE